jgi:hypothetical protein
MLSKSYLMLRVCEEMASAKIVIPGRPPGPGLEAMNTDESDICTVRVLGFRARGLCPRPGMTTCGKFLHKL